MTTDGKIPIPAYVLEAMEFRPSETSHIERRSRSITEPEHLGTHFRNVAQARCFRPAVTCADVTWSYGQLLQAAESIATALSTTMRPVRGERIILAADNSPEYIAAFFGTLLAGGVVVPVTPKIENGALRRVIDSTEAMCLLTRAAIFRARGDLHAAPAGLAGRTGESAQERRQETAEGEASGSPLAAIFFTAGSSGTPKGVMLSHQNLIENARSIQKYLRIDGDDRPLCVLPFYHAFGNSVLQSHLLAGAHLVLDGHPTFPQTIVEALARHKATSLSAVPDLFRYMLERSSLGKTRLPELRCMAVAGGALRRDLAVEVARRIAPAEFFAMYGQTEATARLAYVPPGDLARLPDGCIGRAIPGVTLDVIDENGRSAGWGEIGEVRAQGPNIMLGYWRDLSATEERIRGGWLLTGDLATTDAEGFITLKGRKSSLVKVAGYRVHPADLEEFAVRRLSVKQAVAVAFERNDGETRLALYIRPEVGPDAQALSEMIARSRAELPRHMVPDHIQIVDEFPLNDALKIDRPALSRRAAREAAQRLATG